MASPSAGGKLSFERDIQAPVPDEGPRLDDARCL